jgi:hypothetical protein
VLLALPDKAPDSAVAILGGVQSLLPVGSFGSFGSFGSLDSGLLPPSDVFDSVCSYSCPAGLPLISN